MERRYDIYDLPDKYLREITSCENPRLEKYGVKTHYGDRYRFYKPCCLCLPCKKIIMNDFYDNDIIKNKYLISYQEELKWKIKDIDYLVTKYGDVSNIIYSNEVKNGEKSVEVNG